MKNLLVSCLLFFTHLCFGGVTLGEKAPEIGGKLLDKSLFSTKDYVGKVILINFWASWCEPCKEEMPLIEKFYNAHKKDGFEVLTISLDIEKDLPQAKFILKNFSFLSSYKSDIDYSKYGRIWRIPSTFVIDRKGVLIKNGLTGNPKVDEEVLQNIVLPAILKIN
ncbi:MAG: TlpA disulfide reductase family protein [Betaproteobacteria bacterium]|jgi:thiol-disulfide isomerase/thioredoxin